MTGRRKVQQQRQRQVIPRQRRIEVELFRVREKLGGAQASQACVGEEMGGAGSEIGQRAACVRENDLDVGEIADDAGDDHVDGGTGRLVRVVDDGLG